MAIAHSPGRCAACGARDPESTNVAAVDVRFGGDPGVAARCGMSPAVTDRPLPSPCGRRPPRTTDTLIGVTIVVCA
jgi:hypothetical protein